MSMAMVPLSGRWLPALLLVDGRPLNGTVDASRPTGWHPTLMIPDPVGHGWVEKAGVLTGATPNRPWPSAGVATVEDT